MFIYHYYKCFPCVMGSNLYKWHCAAVCPCMCYIIITIYILHLYRECTRVIGNYYSSLNDDIMQMTIAKCM